MLYDYECRNGHVTEIVSKVNERPRIIKCALCGCFAKQIISRGHGGDQTSEPRWLDAEVRATLQDSDMLAAHLVKPLETRQELKAHLERHHLSPRS